MPKFITFEGIDGTGKSSVCEAVYNELLDEGYKVRLTMEPSEGWLGQIVRQSYKARISPFSEALLFCADRVEHTRQIRDWMAKGYHVLCDRYVDSTVAYQGAILKGQFKAKKGQDLLTWLKDLNRPYILCPDLTLLFLCPAETCLERLGDREEMTKFERLDLLKSVEAIYLERKKGSARFVTIDARKPLDDVVARCLRTVKAAIGKEKAPKGPTTGVACWDDEDEKDKTQEDGDQSSE